MEGSHRPMDQAAFFEAVTSRARADRHVAIILYQQIDKEVREALQEEEREGGHPHDPCPAKELLLKTRDALEDIVTQHCRC